MWLCSVNQKKIESIRKFSKTLNHKFSFSQDQFVYVSSQLPQFYVNQNVQNIKPKYSTSPKFSPF